MYATVVSYCAFIGFTRIFVGLHTLEQILTGFGSGIMVHILVAHIFYRSIEDVFIKIETRKVGFINWLSILYLLANLSVIGFYFIIDGYYPAPEEWLSKIQGS